MKPHKGMRPQDIVILLKIIAKGKYSWQYKDLANELGMSSSEITESLNRSFIAGLIDVTKKKVFSNSLIDFLIYGLRYVFPAQPGALVTGLPTAHSAPVMRNFFIADEQYVWSDAEGIIRGQAIEPLYSTVPKAAKTDEKLYDLLALTDVLRVGRVREIKVAKELILELSKEYYTSQDNFNM
jgi:hypothetical protein